MSRYRERFSGEYYENAGDIDLTDFFKDDPDYQAFAALGEPGSMSEFDILNSPYLMNEIGEFALLYGPEANILNNEGAPQSSEDYLEGLEDLYNMETGSHGWEYCQDMDSDACNKPKWTDTPLTDDFLDWLDDYFEDMDVEYNTVDSTYAEPSSEYNYDSGITTTTYEYHHGTNVNISGWTDWQDPNKRGILAYDALSRGPLSETLDIGVLQADMAGELTTLADWTAGIAGRHGDLIGKELTFDTSIQKLAQEGFTAADVKHQTLSQEAASGLAGAGRTSKTLGDIEAEKGRRVRTGEETRATAWSGIGSAIEGYGSADALAATSIIGGRREDMEGMYDLINVYLGGQ